MMKIACGLCALGFLTQGAGALSSETENSDLLNANRLAAQKKYKEAIEFYRKAVARQPKNATCYHYYGRTLALNGKFEEALKEYKKALEINDGDAEIYNDVGVALAIKGFLPDGAKFIKRAVDLKPRLIVASNNLGAVLTKLGDYEQAVDSFTRSLELQPRNPVIRNRCAEAKLQISKSKHFDFGAVVGPDQIPDITAIKPPPPPELPKETPTVAALPEPPKSDPDDEPPKPTKKKADIDTLMKEAEGWLQSGQRLFLELKADGFDSAHVTGTGVIQTGDKCLSADEVKDLTIRGGAPIEVSGDVSIEFQGKGTVSLGNYRIESQESDGKFSIDCGQEMVTCRSGTFEVTNWPSVNALRDGKRVRIVADRCGKVYAQDDAKVKTSHCTEVSLVSWSTGTVLDCDALLLNDNARGFAVRCNEVTVLGSARAKIYQCGIVERQDQATVEFANSANM